MCKVLVRSHSRPTAFSETRERTGQDEAWAGDGIVFPQNQMGRQVVSSPAVEQRRSRGPEPLEQITQRAALLRVHAVGVYG